ncbi:uncharacterized protein LOC119121442 isoform X2 [Syngnathus acus]|uniref:uncharacterized protein LOC119121442 isoform X2 n=1 Tax=Syngnathus acus TaxID=161584 RepID=UPI0018862667|nr:uncharacterized protein LOC119121442 isoform X2 [Syngnathus acus]
MVEAGGGKCISSTLRFMQSNPESWISGNQSIGMPSQIGKSQGDYGTPTEKPLWGHIKSGSIEFQSDSVCCNSSSLPARISTHTKSGGATTFLQEHQKMWMMTELHDLGLWPGCRPVHRAGNAISLWRFPPQPELVHPEAELPSPNIFQLHPFFIWKPEDEIMVRLRSTYRLPCLHGCPQTQIMSAGEGRPRAIVGTGGQYYILSSQLRCEICRKCWFADNPRWLEKLPERVTNILPALVTSKQAICKTVVDELRCTSKSPSDMVGQLNEILHLRYERAHLAYLHAVENAPRGDNTLQSFGSYEEPEGWCGVSVTDRYLKDCFIEEYMRQEQAINKLLQGTFGRVFRSDHTRKPVETEPASVQVVMKPTNVPLVDVKPENVPLVKMEPDSVPMKPPLSVTPPAQTQLDVANTPEQFFEQFLESEYFQKEMEEAWCQVKKKAGKKRKRKQTWLMGRLCCFCRHPLKEGPKSPHVHTTFPGHAGKYIYCPSKVYNLYKDKGMDKEMNWVEFQASPFYDTEWQRWIDSLDRTGHCPLTPNVHPPSPFSASSSPRNSGMDGWTDDAHS